MDSNYVPQSPDLSGGHRPQSPDLSSLTSPFTNYNQSGRFQGAFGGDNFGIPLNPYHQATSQPLMPMPGPGFKAEPYDDGYLNNMPTAMSGHQNFKPDPQYGYNPAMNIGNFHMNQQPVPFKTEPLVDPTLGCHLKTSFPVARIKRIMQADEDIGKVAQVTPTVVSRALELFMIKLISAAAHQARGTAGPGGASSTTAAKGPRRILVQHLKQAVEADPTFDFLADIIKKVPDAPTKASRKDVGSDSDEAKPKRRGKKRKDSADDF